MLRISPFSRTCTVGIIVLLVAACNAITGASDLTVGEALGPDGGPLPPGADGGPGGNGSFDGGGLPGAFDASPFVPVAKVCADGGVCLPNTGGWTPVFSLLNPILGCPAEWPEPTTYQKSGGGSCDCTCEPTPADSGCRGTLSRRGGGACLGSPVQMPSEGCQTLPGPLPAGSLAFTVTPSQPATSCTAQVVPNLREPTTAKLCGGATPLPSDQCGSDEACIPRRFFGLGATCIMHEGEVDCPPQMPLRTVVGASLTEGRSCSSCSCAPSDCTQGSVRFYDEPGCTGILPSIKVDGTCSPVELVEEAVSYTYTPEGPCRVSQPATVEGSESVEAPRTVCCLGPF